MPRLFTGASGIALLLACTALPAAASDYVRSLAFAASVGQIAAAAADPQADRATAFDLAGSFGVPFASRADHAPIAAPASQAKPTFSMVSIDLVLSQLALQTGANYHVALRQAQTTAQPQVLVLESGTATLSQLYDIVAASDQASLLSRDGSTITSHIPLAIWKGATLIVDKGETLALDRSNGAFLMSAGLLVGREGTIKGSGEPNAHSADFEPFIVMALSGAGQFDGTTFADLGFSGHAPMTGLTFVQGGLYAVDQNSFVRNSRFDHTGSLALLGARDLPVENNVFSASSGPAIIVDGGNGALVSHNLIAATKGGHGIKLTSGAANAIVSDNVIVSGTLNGIYADDGVHDLTLARNLIAGNAKSGVNLASVACVKISGNALVANEGVGISVTASAQVRLEANALQNNAGAGVSISRQRHSSEVALVANRIAGNKIGVTSNVPARLVFEGNDFSGQTPRLLAGELSQFSGQLLDQSAIRDAVLTVDGLELSQAAGPAQNTTIAPTSCDAMEGV